MKNKFIFLYLIFLYISSFSINFSELRGIVLDEKSLKPLVSAKVYVEDEFTFTDTNGEFYVDSLFSGSNLIRVELNGYKNYKNVLFLNKGHNSFKVVLSKMYYKEKNNAEKVQNVNQEKTIKPEKLLKKAEDDIDEECFWLKSTNISDVEKIKKEDDKDSLCQEDLIIKPLQKKDNNDFDTIVGLVNRLDKRALIHGILLDKNTGSPIKNTPIIFNDEIVFTDNNGNYRFYTDKEIIDIEFNCKGFTEINKNIKVSKSEMNIDLFSEKQGGV